MGYALANGSHTSQQQSLPVLKVEVAFYNGFLGVESTKATNEKRIHTTKM